jgi:membrane associated rhomboid family serine protease
VYANHPETKRWKGNAEGIIQLTRKLFKKGLQDVMDPARPLNKKLAIGIVFLFETRLSQELLEEFTYYFGIVPVEYTKHHRHGLPLIDYLSFLPSMFLHGGWLQNPVEANKETVPHKGII